MGRYLRWGSSSRRRRRSQKVTRHQERPEPLTLPRPLDVISMVKFMARHEMEVYKKYAKLGFKTTDWSRELAVIDVKDAFMSVAEARVTGGKAVAGVRGRGGGEPQGMDEGTCP